MRRNSKSDDNFASPLDFSNEWKSLFPVNSIHNAPLLRSSPSTFGPLIFNPVPETVTELISSPSISPLVDFTTAPRLSLSRFLSTSVDPEIYLPPSLASSLSSWINADDYGLDEECELRSNRLQLLNCPGDESVIVFFPIGENFDQIGFVRLVVKDGRLTACGVSDADSDGLLPFKDGKKLVHKIVKMIVNPIDEDLISEDSDCLLGCIGTLMVCTLYSVHWFGVKLIKGKELADEKVCLVYLGSKQFKSAAIADVAWSPHFVEESVVLLESGELFLFDLNKAVRIDSLNKKYKGRRIAILSKESSVSEKGKWCSCEFSWHPQILVVCHQEAIFSLDWRSEEVSVSCLARIEALVMNNQFPEKDMFITLARAGSDGFQVVVASKTLLAVFDIRKPKIPILQWHHNLDEPTYLEVHKLSDLRSGLKDDSHAWATKTGSCIILGSFWHNEFSVFCYGSSEPTPTGSLASKISQLSSVAVMYAWELPSDIMLTGNDCRCGSCLINNEFIKDALPKWAAWQQKKEIILGYGMVSTNMFSMLSEARESGGFTLVRLLSSGKLESQRYSASWKFSNGLEKAHEKTLMNVGDNILISASQEKYKFPRRFKYSKLDNLSAYLNGDLSTHLISNQGRPFGSHKKTDFCNLDSYKFAQEKLKSFRLGMPKSNTDILEDVSFPSSIHEVAVRRMWANLPLNLLQLAFSNYSELLDVRVDKKESSLEFLPVPQELQLPPFFSRKCSERSNKWSGKVKRSSDIVGPLLPLPVLAHLHKASVESSSLANQADEFSFDCEISNRCREVENAAKALAVTIMSDATPVTTLENDKEDTANCSKTLLNSSNRDFFMYTRGPTPYKHLCSTNNPEKVDEERDYQHATYISKLHMINPRETMNDAEQEHLTDLGPVRLKFQRRVVVGKESQHAFSMLKRKLPSLFASVNSYQEICRSSKYQKKG